MIRFMKYYTAKEIAEISGMSPEIIRRWARKNVASIGDANRKTFLWTENDLQQFLTRNKQRGRPRDTQE